MARRNAIAAAGEGAIRGRSIGEREGTPVIEIDGRSIAIQPGETVLRVARRLGIVIPTLCDHPDLSPVGACRLCIVEEQRLASKVPACTLLARDGMVLRTESAAIRSARRLVLRSLLQRCGGSRANAHNELGRWASRYGVHVAVEECEKGTHRVDPFDSPVLRVDMNQCILCSRCIRACAEIQGRFVWHWSGRGERLRVVPGTDTNLRDARCEDCGACAAYCPTGAISDRALFGAPAPDRLVRTTCGYCGVGCQLDLNVFQNRVLGVTSSSDAPVNGMSLCVKGRYGQDFIHHPDRLTRPMVREHLLRGEQGGNRSEAGRAAEWVPVDWATVISLVARRFEKVRRESGGDALAFLSSAKCTNEENYLLQKLARQVLGTNNVDHCARLCHAPTVVGLNMAFGSGAMSNSLRDVAEHAAAFFVIGSNTTEQHPVFGAMLRQAVLRRGARLVVADPRRIDLAEFACLHVRQRPGTDTALVNGLMQVILERGWHDGDFIERRCENFEAFAASLMHYRPGEVERITGVPAGQIVAAAELLAQSRPMAVIWAMGITQHTTGVSNVLALANLQMLLGNMGVPGGGVNPLRGQNNVQGACDMGALPNVLPGYQLVSDESVRRRFSEAWALSDGAEPGNGSFALPRRPGLTVTEIVEGAGAGSIRGLYVLGEDLAMTEPDCTHTHECLARAEFLVVQEIFPSETARFADVLLPGVSFAEKLGTFTNTERRVQPVRPAVPPPGEALQDWEILARIARELLRLRGARPTGPLASWEAVAPDKVLEEIAAVTPSYAGVSHHRLESGETLQWPVPDRKHPGTPILHRQTFTRGLGRFHVVDYLPPAELPDAEFPWLLTTGRVLYHWHGGELSRRSAALQAACGEPLVEISAEDAARTGISHGGPIRVDSRRGTMLARAHVTNRVGSGVVFGNFHFPGDANVNVLTNRALDPQAKIPEYKVCAVRVSPGKAFY